MANYRQFLRRVLCLAGLLSAISAKAGADDEFLAGPAYAKFRLTLTPGWREEAAGPFFYEQDVSGQAQWGLPPLFCRTLTPEVDWSEWEFLYPVMNYRRFGKEYRLQLAQVLSFSGGQTPEDNSVSHATLFPFYFHQHSTETNHDYNALFPLYGHLENRMFRTDIKFVLFPLYSETRKKDVVTYNYLYPIFDLRRGDGLTGWEVWPLGGEDRKTPTFRTNSMGDVATIGGYDKFFALWPFYFNSRAGVGTTNPATSLTMVPFYSQTRSPARDEFSYGFPLGFNSIHDHEQNYVEHDFIWPLFVWAHGSKTVTRYFPFYSRARHNGLESVFFGFFLYKYNRLEAPPLDRHRTRVLYCLYSDTVERNTQSHEFKRRVDFWPFYSYRRDLDGNRRLQVFAVLEPIFPNNRTIAREYSPIWSLWRAEKNSRTGAYSKSLLWNLYRHESVGPSKKASLLFGLFQYQSTPDGGRWRMARLNVGGKTARPAATKS
jgi:hypothetical protein